MSRTCHELSMSFEKSTSGSFLRNFKLSVSFPGLIVRKLKATSRDTHPVVLTQLQYKGWPDHGVPASTDDLLDVRRLMKTMRLKCLDPESPILVHSSTGVGRTGTFIAFDNIASSIEKRGKTEDVNDIVQCVSNLREERCQMVRPFSLLH